TSCQSQATGGPLGAVAGGCPTYAGGPYPTPIEIGTPGAVNSWTPLAANSKNITGSMLNLLNNSTFNPNGRNFDPHVYGHAFLRTAGISGGSYSGGTIGVHGGLTGTCTSANCTINQAFLNVGNGGGNSTSQNTGAQVPGVGSCDLNASPA